MPADPEVSPLVITGQRRLREAPWSPFPSHHEPLVGPPRDEAEIGEEGGETSPCDDPDFRREWDTDAAAAKARDEFLERAATESQSVAYRERTAVLYRNDEGGISVGEIGEGAPMTGAATYNFTGIAGDRVVGLIHVHPGSNIPSAADWTGYEAYGGWFQASGGNPADLRIYIVGAPHPPSPITVFSLAERESGVEVNPSGEPC